MLKVFFIYKLLSTIQISLFIVYLTIFILYIVRNMRVLFIAFSKPAKINKLINE